VAKYQTAAGGKIYARAPRVCYVHHAMVAPLVQNGGMGLVQNQKASDEDEDV